MTTLTWVTGGSNAELLTAALAGEQRAWDALVERYTRLVWHTIHGFSVLSTDDRADVHQTVWLRFAEKLDTIRNPDRIGAWLATTARNECIRQLRVRGREVPDPDAGAEVASDATAGEQTVLDEERNQHLWEVFGELRTGCQQLLRLLLTEPPLSYAEIAEILDMPVGSIGPTRQRCLDQLRLAFESDSDPTTS